VIQFKKTTIGFDQQNGYIWIAPLVTGAEFNSSLNPMLKLYPGFIKPAFLRQGIIPVERIVVPDISIVMTFENYKGKRVTLSAIYCEELAKFLLGDETTRLEYGKEITLSHDLVRILVGKEAEAASATTLIEDGDFGSVISTGSFRVV
jgi:hypothetical protein